MDTYKEIVESINLGQVFVVATIVKTTGSTPRKTGAKMLVYSDSTISGTVGGGDFERIVIDDCLKLIESNTLYLLKKYSFSLQGENATGMCCGGNVEVFMEVQKKPKRIVIFGGGHIGKEIVRIVDRSDFCLTVVDDRKEIIDLFDDSVDTKLTAVDFSGDLPKLDENCFAVILSRSHQTDCIILQSVLKSNCQYIGLIGSKAKISKMFGHLKDSGVEQNLLDKVHTPIGLDINAESPFEIAVLRYFWASFLFLLPIEIWAMRYQGIGICGLIFERIK